MNPHPPPSSLTAGIPNRGRGSLRRRAAIVRYSSSVLPSERGPSAGSSFWLTRFLILRLLGFVYFFAFLSAAKQVLPLMGSEGLTPASAWLDQVGGALGSRLAGFMQIPSVFWINASDRALVGAAWLGAALALLVIAGLANALLLGLMWALYMSFVHVGQEWYGYGWEIQLLETGFLAIFLCPLLDPRPFPRRPPPRAVLWLFRWLILRIMLGAGLIKLRGDSCWRDLTCLDYHYLTQPIPNPLSRWFHFHPTAVHKTEVLYNHLVELVSSWFALAPDILRSLRITGGVAMLAFQISLILSGNLSFLNYLTIVPILACFDDDFLRSFLPRPLVAAAARAAESAAPSRAQTVVARVLVVLVALLSLPVVLNLVSARQVMNTSFDPLDLVNTYGAFGTVGRERYEIVFEGTRDSIPGDATRWIAYEFPAKPGDPMRRPPVIAPFQPRLDWSIWFAAMSTPDQYPWTLHFEWKLLHGDRGVMSLLANDPFPGAPPHWIRASYYRYEFAPPGNPGHAWWERQRVGDWLPPLSAADPRLRQIAIERGWRPAP
ncbi:MAG: lipase maturation factor family protein [Candidatus Eisenbacteria bacterium]|uniref:Lipase maturation factor family protein n=1 Tax=Eiseniibacteriota bacterium TaxID=2212470 RepID=A0A538S9D5_UNCEI|nr:MAG: lipase maturation factor family protein [Candidatus Eisenbacteria bacterium]